MPGIGIGISPFLDSFFWGGTAPPPPPSLKLTFDGTFPVASPSSVSDWNTFFTLPTNGTVFTSVVIVGNVAHLIGATNITFKTALFNTNGHLIKVEDEVSCVKTLGIQSLRSCSKLTTVILPGVTTTNNVALQINTALTTIQFDSLVTLAGTQVLQGCTMLTAVTATQFPLLQTITSSAFRTCTGITTINLPLLTSLGNDAFFGATGLISANVYLPLITIINGFQGAGFTAVNHTMFPLATSIANNGIRNNPNLTTIDLANVTQIGTAGCGTLSSISTVNLPSISSVGDDAFINSPIGSTILNSFTNLISAGVRAFSGCNITTINLANLLNIGDSGFASNTLTTINLPSVSTIGDMCFCNTDQLTDIFIPSCTALGNTTGDDSVFLAQVGGPITLTVPVALMTCDSGNPDGDIVYLQTNNTVVVIPV